MIRNCKTGWEDWQDWQDERRNGKAETIGNTVSLVKAFKMQLVLSCKSRQFSHPVLQLQLQLRLQSLSCPTNELG
jgi:hypothetical protein